MNISTVFLFLAGALGMSAAFVDSKTIAHDVQVMWLVCVVALGVIGCALWVNDRKKP